MTRYVGKRRHRSRRPVLGSAVVAGLMLPVAAGAVLATTGGAATAAATTTVTTVTAQADAYVHKSYPSTNYGTALQVRADGSPVVRGLMAFRVPALSAPVSKAVLQVYAVGTTSAGVAVRTTDTTWTELGVTWSNQPALGTTIASSGATSKGTWTNIDVTSAVKAAGDLGLAVVTASGTPTAFASRETSTPPRLVVTTSAAATTSTTSAPTSSTGLKPPVQGLMDRHHFPSSGYTSAIRNWVVDVPWASLQVAQGAPITRPNAIDSAVAAARAQGMHIKLRVLAGVAAPDWAKQLGGAPIPVFYTTSGVLTGSAGTIGRFWTPAFGAAYADLQAKLAAIYDATPEIGETVVTRCGMIYPETYLRDTMNPANVQALLAAGFTRAADDACHDQQVLAHDVWKATRSEVAFNPYQAIQPDGSVKQDTTYTLAQLDQCRQALGRRCVLANYSLSSTRPSGSDYAAIYTRMKQLGAPIAFQTATYAKIGDWQWTLDWAANEGANNVELPTGYTNWPASTLATYAQRLVANPVG